MQRTVGSDPTLSANKPSNHLGIPISANFPSLECSYPDAGF